MNEKVKAWEHNHKTDKQFRGFWLTFDESNFDHLKDYLTTEDWNYIMSKGNRSSLIEFGNLGS